MRKITNKCLLIAALLMPLQPVVIMAKAAQADAQQALLQQIMQHMQGPSMQAFAKQAIGNIPSFDHKDIIIGKTEFAELQLGNLAKKLDKTETNLGSQALKQSLKPIANLELILKRQGWVKVVADDQAIYKKFKSSLKRIKKSEHALLAYWDASQRENGSKLFARAESFYYSVLQKLFGSKINDNKWSLEASMIQEMGVTAFNLLFYIGLQALATEIFAHYVTGSGNVGDPEKGRFSLWEGFKNGFKMLFNVANPTLTDFGRTHLGIDKNGNPIYRLEEDGTLKLDKDGKPIQAGRTTQTFSHCLTHGSLRDIWTAFTTNYNNESRYELNFVGAAIKKTANCCGFECNKIEKTEEVDANGEKHTHYAWKVTNEAAKERMSKLSKAGRYGFGAAGTAAITYYRAVMLYEAGKTTFTRAKNIITTMKELHTHTIHLARVINTAKELAIELEKNPVLGSSTIIDSMNKVLKNPSAEMKKLLELLENDTFVTSKSKTHIFSRGNVLLAHRLMSRVRDEIVPLLQGVGELDALCAIVANVKEMASTKTPFSFAEFVPSTQAIIELEDAWLPLVHNAVPNTIAFGGSQPNKIIITGPNGGGKSVFLKVLGVVTALAQSWGIVPAKQVRMTIFDGLRSCIHPEESIEHELSTFMAEKMRMDDIKQFVFSHKDSPFKVMLLLDEPYRGTVEAESADRIYADGIDLASLPQSIVMIATHVEKPVKLAQDTQGAFANYHVSIKELSDGRFEREFKLEPGILEWWFKDGSKRSRFINFITMEKHKEQIAKMMAEKQAAQAMPAA